MDPIKVRLGSNAGAESLGERSIKITSSNLAQSGATEYTITETASMLQSLEVKSVSVQSSGYEVTATQSDGQQVKLNIEGDAVLEALTIDDIQYEMDDGSAVDSCDAGAQISDLANVLSSSSESAALGPQAVRDFLLKVKDKAIGTALLASKEDKLAKISQEVDLNSLGLGCKPEWGLSDEQATRYETKLTDAIARYIYHDGRNCSTMEQLEGNIGQGLIKIQCNELGKSFLSFLKGADFASSHSDGSLLLGVQQALLPESDVADMDIYSSFIGKSGGVVFENANKCELFIKSQKALCRSFEQMMAIVEATDYDDSSSQSGESAAQPNRMGLISENLQNLQEGGRQVSSEVAHQQTLLIKFQRVVGSLNSSSFQTYSNNSKGGEAYEKLFSQTGSHHQIMSDSAGRPGRAERRLNDDSKQIIQTIQEKIGAGLLTENSDSVPEIISELYEYLHMPAVGAEVRNQAAEGIKQLLLNNGNNVSETDFSNDQRDLVDSWDLSTESFFAEQVEGVDGSAPL